MSIETFLFWFAGIQALGVVLNFFRVDYRIFSKLGVGLGERGMTPLTRREKIVTAMAFGSLLTSALGLYRLSANEYGQVKTLVHFNTPILTRGEKQIVEGKEAFYNLGVQNLGPELIAHEFISDVMLYLLPDSTTASDEINKFEAFVKAAKGKNLVPQDLSVGTARYGSHSTRKLTSRDVEDIHDGRLKLYVFGWIRYRDSGGMHEGRYCVWLQPPGDALAWHSCPGVPDTTR